MAAHEVAAHEGTLAHGGRLFTCKVSPKQGNFEEAQATANSLPHNTLLLAVEQPRLTLADATNRLVSGQDVLLAPENLGTNITFLKGEEFDRLFPHESVPNIHRVLSLYMDLTGGLSQEVCDVDILAAVSTNLDYQLQRFLKGKIEFSVLFGPGKVFLDDRGKHVKYMRVLKYIEDNKYVKAPKTANNVRLCERLAEGAEFGLLSTLPSLGFPAEAYASHYQSEIRRQMVVFMNCAARRERVTLSHLFTELFKIDTDNNLQGMNLSALQHPVEGKLFNMSDQKSLFFMGIRKLVLDDIRVRYNMGMLGSNSMGYLFYLGIEMISQLMCHKCSKSIRYTFGSVARVYESTLTTQRGPTFYETCDLTALRSVVLAGPIPLLPLPTI